MGTTLTAIVEAETARIPVEFFFRTATAADVTAVEWIDPCVGNCKKRRLVFWNDLDGPWL